MSSTCIYPTLDNLSERAIELNFTPSESELRFCKQQAKKQSQQTCFLIMLKTTQFLYREPKPDETSYSVIRQVSQSMGRNRLTKAAFKQYFSTGAKTRHMKMIRQYLNLKPVTHATQAFLNKTALNIAKTKINPIDIVNACIEYLIREHLELPGLSVIEKAASKAITHVNHHLYYEISNLLSDEQKKRIDAMLEPAPDDRTTDWNRLKSSPKKPTPQNIKDYLEHLSWLNSIAEDIRLPKDLATMKMNAFRDDARSLDAARMKALYPTKRHAIAAVLILCQLSGALDNLVIIFMRTIQEIESKGKRLFAEYCLKKRSKSTQLINHFKELLTAFEDAQDELEQLSIIDTQINPNLDQWLEACGQYLSDSKSKHLPFMLKAYRNKRSLIFSCLEHLNIQACVGNEHLLKAWQLVLAHKDNNAKYLSLYRKGDPTRLFATHWIGDLWHTLVSPKSKLSKAKQLNKTYFELCLFFHIKEEFRVGDLYVEGADEYSNDADRFIDDDTLADELPAYGDLVQLPTEPSAFSSQLRDELTKLCIEVDEKFPEIEEAWFDNGVLKLKQVRSANKKKVNKALDAQLKQHLERVSIVDVISDTVNWLDLDQFFGPLSGETKRILNPKERLVSTLFCYGCNLGPSQTAECLKGLNRRQISWLNHRHASEKQLKKAIEKVVNTYQKMDIAQYWGKGESLSADGTHRNTYEDNLLSQFHFRYRKKGLICYFLTSDNYICLFSHFIPCGVHESNYILDGLNESMLDIKPKKIHGDTHAQTLSTFGLSYLLGFNLMPRIRKIKKLKFYKPSEDLNLKHIGKLFSDTIDWQLIEDYLPEMYRTVISVKKGIITPSAILRRAGGRSRKNRRYYAFQELGKVIRTIFLLRYISNYELRQYIHRETNKSEQFNNFAQWVAFHNDGIIAENLESEQDKIIQYQHLVANLVILYNAEKMTRALKKIQEGGFELTEQHMFHLSPYWTSHINRLGQYLLNTTRKVDPIDFSFSLFDQ